MSDDELMLKRLELLRLYFEGLLRDLNRSNDFLDEMILILRKKIEAKNE